MAGKCYFLIVIIDIIQIAEIIAVHSARWGRFTQAIKRVSHPSLDIIASRLGSPPKCAELFVRPASSLVRIRFKAEGAKPA